MSLASFDFPYHTCSIKYPKRGSQVQLGGSYTYSVKPATPAMRTLQLTFDVMCWFKDQNNLLVPYISPEINLMRLDSFYQSHELFKDFLYTHELYGNMVVKFSEPLEIPIAKRNSDGAVIGLTLTLMEQPV